MRTILGQLSGSKISSQQDLSPRVMLMTGQSPKCSPASCKATLSATSLQALEGGAMHCSSQESQRQLDFGQGAAHASHSAQQGKNLGKKTSGTFGLSFSTSFASANLSASLANRLQVQLSTAGSTEYRQTWNRRITPAARQYWAHTASAHHTCDRGSTGWPTPTVDDAHNVTRKSGAFQSLTRTARLAIGTSMTLYPAKMESTGELSPAHSRWLMGFPAEWCAWVPMEMPSSRRLRRNL